MELGIRTATMVTYGSPEEPRAVLLPDTLVAPIDCGCSAAVSCMVDQKRGTAVLITSHWHAHFGFKSVLMHTGGVLGSGPICIWPALVGRVPSSIALEQGGRGVGRESKGLEGLDQRLGLLKSSCV